MGGDLWKERDPSLTAEDYGGVLLLGRGRKVIFSWKRPKSSGRLWVSCS